MGEAVVAASRRGSGAALKLTGAAVMAAAAIYLLNPTLVDLGFYLESRKHELLAYTLIYTAGLIAIAATVGEIRTGNFVGDVIVSLTAGTFALLAWGFLFGALTVNALFRDEPNFWVALLAVPAALCLHACLTAGSEGRATGGVTPAETWSIGRAIAGYAWVAFAFSVCFTVGLAIIGLDYVVYRLLEANLLDDRDIHLGRIFARLLNAAWPLIVNIGPYLLLSGVLFALTIAAINLASRLLGALFALLPRAKPRALTHEEAAYIVRSEAALRAYAEERGYSRFAAPILWGVLANATMFVALAAYIALELHNWIPRPYSADQLSGIGWHIFHNEPTNASLLIIFAFIGWSLLPIAVAYRFSPRFAEVYGWSGFGLKSAGVSPAPYVEAMIRNGQLSPSQPFESGRFLRALNKSFEPYVFLPTVALTFAAAIVWHHDMSRYYLMTDDHIEVMNYWTLKKQQTKYADVSSVALGCELSEDDEPDPSYEIELPNNFSIAVWGSPSLADLHRIDGKIPETVERRFRSGYDVLCVEKYASGLEEAAGERMREAFRAEEWHRRRWEARISKPK